MYLFSQSYSYHSALLVVHTSTSTHSRPRPMTCLLSTSYSLHTCGPVPPMLLFVANLYSSHSAITWFFTLISYTLGHFCVSMSHTLHTRHRLWLCRYHTYTLANYCVKQHSLHTRHYVWQHHTLYHTRALTCFNIILVTHSGHYLFQQSSYPLGHYFVFNIILYTLRHYWLFTIILLHTRPLLVVPHHTLNTGISCLFPQLLQHSAITLFHQHLLLHHSAITCFQFKTSYFLQHLRPYLVHIILLQTLLCHYLLFNIILLHTRPLLVVQHHTLTHSAITCCSTSYSYTLGHYYT